MKPERQKERESTVSSSVLLEHKYEGVGDEADCAVRATAWKAFYAALRNLASILKAIVNQE